MRPWLLSLIWLALCGVVVFTTLDLSRPVTPGPAPVAFLEPTDAWADSVLARLSPSEKLYQLLLLRPGLADTGSLPSVGGLLLPAAGAYQLPEGLPPLRVHQGQEERGLPSPWAWGAIQDDSLLRLAGHLYGRELRGRAAGLWLTPLPAPALAAFQQLEPALAATGVLAGPGPWPSYFPQEWDTTRLRLRLAPLKRLAQGGLPVLLLDSADVAQVRPDAREPAVIRAYLQQWARFEGLLLAPAARPGPEGIQQAALAGADLILLSPAEVPMAIRTLDQMRLSGSLPAAEIDARVRRSLLARRWVATRRALPAPSPDTVAWLQHRLMAASLTVLPGAAPLPVGPLDEQAVHLLSVGDEFPDLLAQMRAYGPVSHSRLRLEAGEPIPALRTAYLDGFSPVVIALGPAVTVDSSRDAAFLASLDALAARTAVVLLVLGEDPTQWADLAGPHRLMQVYGANPLAQRLAGQALYGGLSPQGRLPLALGPWPAGAGEGWPQTRLGYGPPELVGIPRSALARIDSIVYEGIYAGAMPGCQVLVARRGQVIWHQAYGAQTYARQRWVDETDLYDLASVTKVAATTMAVMRLASMGRLQVEAPLSRYFSDLMVDLDSVRGQDTLYVHRDSLRPARPDTLPPDFVRVSQRSGPRLEQDTLEWGTDSLMIVQRWVVGRQRRPARWASLTLADLLTHHSGLPAGLPILPYLSNRRKGLGPYDRYYRDQADSLAHREVAADFFLEDRYADSLWRAIKQLSLDPARAYAYSDANLILVQQALDSLTGWSLDSLLQAELYGPLGMQHTMFRPRQRVEVERIVPTEYDGTWRRQLLRGYVHDPTAALLGGVAGHAGLFSNAGDLAHLGQLLLNGGRYGGKAFFTPEVVATFTRRQRGHRGYGFDLPPLAGDYLLSGYASPRSFGHTGFTGTCIWVDPEAELVFIFLSNRVHPRASNWRLNELRIRQRIHDVVYEAIAAGEGLALPP